jgi:hypothetical protein
MTVFCYVTFACQAVGRHTGSGGSARRSLSRCPPMPGATQGPGFPNRYSSMADDVQVRTAVLKSAGNYQPGRVPGPDGACVVDGGPVVVFVDVFAH